MLAIPEREPAASRWATRAALFAFGLIVAAAFLHRVFGMPTPVAFNLFVVALGVALLSILFALAAAIIIWQTGRPGTPRVLFAVCLSLVLLAGPLLYLVWVRDHPLVSDITTDIVDPPPFTTVSKFRGPGSNPIAYDRARAAEEQMLAYPDIRPMRIDRSSEEVFALVVDAVKRLKMHPEREEAPDIDTGSAGVIEAVDRTLLMGFYDDVAIRVSGNAETARVDIRSAARFGSGDMGRNAERVRELMKEIRARLDATVPTVVDARQKGSQQGETKPERGSASKRQKKRR